MSKKRKQQAQLEETLRELNKLKSSICAHCKRVCDDLELVADGEKLTRLCPRCISFFDKLHSLLSEPRNMAIMAKLKEIEEMEKNN